MSTTGEQVLSLIKKTFPRNLTVLRGQGGIVALAVCLEGLPGLTCSLVARGLVADLGFFACGSEDGGFAAARFFALSSGPISFWGCSCVCTSGGVAGVPDDGVSAALFFALGSGLVAFVGCSFVCKSGGGAVVSDE